MNAEQSLPAETVSSERLLASAVVKSDPAAECGHPTRGWYIKGKHLGNWYLDRRGKWSYGTTSKLSWWKTLQAAENFLTQMREANTRLQQVRPRQRAAENNFARDSAKCSKRCTGAPKRGFAKRYSGFHNKTPI